MGKIPVGVLGATGMVGQQYLALLARHPWFEAVYVAASPRSAGKTYREAVFGRWQHAASYNAEGQCWEYGGTYAPQVGDLTVEDAGNVEKAAELARKGKLSFVFSALEMDKDAVKSLEERYAAAGIPVVSNASANRWTEDVPMLIPEVNGAHAGIIPAQRKKRGWDKGFIAVKPNCSIQSYMIPLFALLDKGYELKRVFVTTMQAVSGAGFPGVPSLNAIDNVVPFIGGEEEKTEQEPLKIFGRVDNQEGKIVNAASPVIAAHCNRVPVTDGHTACVSVEFGAKKPGIDEVKKIWREFQSYPQRHALPMAPEHPIIVRDETDRPQPRKDRLVEKGMAVTVGRVRPCPLFDIRFVGLSHNTMRGAAGGGVLNAELLKEMGYIG
ncbi:MAG: aspartate-semialdehyde dehydrogenase [Spirochaetaceae bacterium]|jgi:aspartate-semialdehyde dehydrogenase|nr:aspartate-semialdehyde dehydrogenase [Spirochaetaceae bacterium]